MPTARRLAEPLAALALLAGCSSQPLRIEAPETSTTPGQPSDAPLTRTPRPLDNIRNLPLRDTILADPKVPAGLKETIRDCRTCGLGDPVYTDLTKDRVDDVLVPVLGSNGWAGAIAYTVVEGQVQLLFAYQGAKADVTAKDGDIVLSEQLYAPDDPQCCATGPLRIRTYTWNGRRMILRSTTNDRKGYAPYDNETKVVL